MGDVNTNIRIDELETKIKELEAKMVTAQNIVDVLVHEFTKNATTETQITNPQLAKLLGEWQWIWLGIS